MVLMLRMPNATISIFVTYSTKRGELLREEKLSGIIYLLTSTRRRHGCYHVDFVLTINSKKYMSNFAQYICNKFISLKFLDVENKCSFCNNES